MTKQSGIPLNYFLVFITAITNRRSGIRKTCSGICVSISSPTSSKLAPLSMSRAASSTCPPHAARVRGDSNESAGMLTCAPLSNNSRATSTWPSWDSETECRNKHLNNLRSWHDSIIYFPSIGIAHFGMCKTELLVYIFHVTQLKLRFNTINSRVHSINRISHTDSIYKFLVTTIGRSNNKMLPEEMHKKHYIVQIKFYVDRFKES